MRKGSRHTPEVRAQISASMRGNQNAVGNRGRPGPKPAQEIERMRRSKTGLPLSAEHRRAISEGNRRAWKRRHDKRHRVGDG
jgi:NUMOD3 motif